MWGTIQIRATLLKIRYRCALALIWAVSVIQVHARPESGYQTLPFGGATIGDVNHDWGYRRSVVYVHNSFFDAHLNNMVFKTKEGIVFVDAPIPTYPRGASGLKGRAVLRLRIDQKNGRVRSVTVLQSSGHAVLDQAAVNALQKWRTTAGVKGEFVDVPVVFAAR